MRKSRMRARLKGILNNPIAVRGLPIRTLLEVKARSKAQAGLRVLYRGRVTT